MAEPTEGTAPSSPTKQLPVRTLVQGAAVVGLLAVLQVVQSAAASGVDKVNWAVTGTAAATAALMGVASYIMAKVRPPS